MTSGQTAAMSAAAAEVPYGTGFGGNVPFTYAPDCVRAFIDAAPAAVGSHGVILP